MMTQESPNSESKQMQVILAADSRQHLRSPVEVRPAIIDAPSNQVGTQSAKGVSADQPDKIPADFSQAEDHQKACLVGANSSMSRRCDCCARVIEKELLNIKCDVKEFSFLGSGYPLYFSFLKYCIVFLSLILVFSGGFNILTNAIYGKECKDETTASSQCKNNWITKLSLGNKQNESGLMFVQECLNLLTIIIVIALLQVFRRDQRQLDADCDEADISANDYTLLFEDIPIEYTAMNDDYDDDLKFFIETSVKQRLAQKNHAEGQAAIEQTIAGSVAPAHTLLPQTLNNSSEATLPTSKQSQLDVVKINLCYNLTEQTEITKKKAKLIKKKQSILKGISKNKITDVKIVEKVNSKLLAVDEKLTQFQMKFADGKGTEFMKQYFTGKALVSFQTEQMKEEVLDLFSEKKYVKDLTYHGSHLKVSQAPQPTDMYWENLHISESEKTKRMVIGLGVSVFSLLSCAGLIYLLLLVQKSQKSTNANETASTAVQAIAILLSVAITLLNVVLQMILKYLAAYEACFTRTEYNINIAKKIAWATFINTALIQFIIDVVLNSTDDKFGVIFGDGGLVFNQNYVFISNMALPFIIESIDPPSIIQKLKLKVFECPSFEIYQKYALNIKTMFLVAFYSPILPIGILYSMIAILLIYWADKYNLLRRKTIKFQQSAELSVEMTEMIEYILPIYSLSNTIFFIYIVGSEDVSALSWIGLAIGVVHSALPMQEWNERFFRIREAVANEMNYLEAEKSFVTDYERENPATSLVYRNTFINNRNNNQFANAKDANKPNQTPLKPKDKHQIIEIEKLDSLEDDAMHGGPIKMPNSQEEMSDLLSNQDAIYQLESAMKLNGGKKIVSSKQETSDTTTNPLELHKQTPHQSKFSQQQVVPVH